MVERVVTRGAIDLFLVEITGGFWMVSWPFVVLNIYIYTYIDLGINLPFFSSESSFDLITQSRRSES